MPIRSLLLAGWLLLNCGCASTTGYLVKQGRHLLRDIRGAKSLDALLASRGTDPETRAFLMRAAEIRRFAVERIGLRNTKNFSRYKDIGRDHLASVVSACAADSFDPYTWRYPLLGKLPYRGYYERADAEKEAERLKAEGWDVIIRPVDSFSTLGFLRDPLYSFMKGYSDFELASLILHELTHATLFVKGQTQFSEELASFVGEQGALVWLAQTRGSCSREYRQAIDALHDQEVFRVLLRELKSDLERVYRSPITRQEKLTEKSRLIGAFQAAFEAEKEARFRTAEFRLMPAPRLNNAYLALFSLYSDDVDLIRSYWEQRCGGDFQRLLMDCKSFARRGDVKEQMRRALGEGAAAFQPLSFSGRSPPGEVGCPG